MTVKRSAQEIIELQIKLAGRSKSYLTLILRGHHIIERLIDAAIRLKIDKPPKEFDRLGFAVKLELVGAFNILPSDALPLFRLFNTLRNRFAHNPFTQFSSKDAKKLRTSLSKAQRLVVQNGSVREPFESIVKREFLWRCILAMYAEFHLSLKHNLREKVTHGVLTAKLVEAANKAISEGRIAPGLSNRYDEEIEEAIRKTNLLRR